MSRGAPADRPGFFPTRLRAALSGYDRRLWILYGGFVASSMGFAMIVPFVSLYFHEELGVPMSLVGLFFLVTAVVRSVFGGYAGDLSDRVGRIRLMAAGQAARGVVFGVLVVAVFGGAGFWVSAGILILSYIAGAFYQPVASAAVSDLVPPERRLDAYALMRVAHNLGWGIGPMLGGFVAAKGYAWLFLVGAVTSLISAWLVHRFVAETHPPGAVEPVQHEPAPSATERLEPAPDRSGPHGVAPKNDRPAIARDAGGPAHAREPVRSGSARGGWSAIRDLAEVRHDRRLLVFCGLALLVFMTMSQWLSTLSVYASDRLDISTSQLGLMFGVNGFMVVAFQWPVTRALRRIGLIPAIVLGSLVYTGSFFSIAFATGYGHLVAAMVAITVGELIVSPPVVAIVSLIAPEGRMGRYMGIYSLTTSFGWSAGPFVGGILIDLWMGRPVLLWGVIASFTAVAALGFWRVRGMFPEARAGLERR